MKIFGRGQGFDNQARRIHNNKAAKPPTERTQTTTPPIPVPIPIREQAASD